MTTVVRSRLRAPDVKAIARSRLDDIVAQAWNHRVTMLLAPAGSGKTTAMAGFANGSDRPVGWISCGGIDDTARGFVAHLNAALHEVAPSLELGWETIDEAIDALVDLSNPIGIAVDDVHTLTGTAAERALRQLIEDAPEPLHIVLAGRREPGFDLSVVRMMGQLLMIESDDLRFRSWEAEQLFRDLYETWLRPDDIARLARRVEGWAAGLQMFHLAARGLSPPEQRRLIDRLNGRARIVRDYLAANVLEPIGAELRRFLIDTCVLGIVTPVLADELRGEPDSERHLRELASSQLFTVAIDEDTYRYHEVLRTQLELLLIERDGTDRAAIRHRTAGELLEVCGFRYDALRCFARAGEWAAVRRLANPSGEEPQAPATAWIGDLPRSIVADDPWLLLARARAERRAGTWARAIESFHAAESKGLGTEFVDQCRTERSELAAWLDPLAQAPSGWVGPARAGCDLEADDVVSVSVTVQSCYPDPALHVCAITEVEFFKKK
jgi:ATP/maltotriose-dependent transcriptional regulator MalT